MRSQTSVRGELRAYLKIPHGSEARFSGLNTELATDWQRRPIWRTMQLNGRYAGAAARWVEKQKEL